MITPTKAYDGLPALAEGSRRLDGDRRARRPVRIAPRMAVTAKALDAVAPGWPAQRADETAALQPGA